MLLRDNAGVYTANGDKVGGVDRVVIDPKSKEVTHIVVRKGTLLPTDKVVPTDLIESADDDRVVLRATGGDLESLPDFEEDYFVPVTTGDAPRAQSELGAPLSVYWYPPVAGGPYEVSQRESAGPRYSPARVRISNIPDRTVALKTGAKVISVDDEHVGNVAKVFTAEGSDRATHFVISSGMIFKDQKLVPALWVNRIEEDRVHLSVGSELIESLRDYRD